MKTVIAIWGKFPSSNNGCARPYKSMRMLSVKILCQALETTYPGLGELRGDNVSEQMCVSPVKG
jgi:hypothetical protein